MRCGEKIRGRSIRIGFRARIALTAATALTGCVGLHQTQLGTGEQPTLIGPAVRDNRTPMDAALGCFAGTLIASRPAQQRPLVIGVGDVRDYTGKYSINEGSAITQGGALMVSSALGKLGGAVRLAERFDPVIAERELGYTDHRQLGDGQAHDVTGTTGSGKVPWLPYFGGSIAASDYYIVGGITELNYDIRSGGIETGVSSIGPKARTYTESVAIDLRIVDTRTLLVLKTVSLTKQFTGYEVGFNIFRFFGSDLFDINLGAKGQEPLQLGVRAALEEATMKLVGAVSRVDPQSCLGRRGWPLPATTAAVIAVPARSEVEQRARRRVG
jgi:curli biogenesis system outer membrane secretion channel CsgG